MPFVRSREDAEFVVQRYQDSPWNTVATFGFAPTVDGDPPFLITVDCDDALTRRQLNHQITGFTLGLYAERDRAAANRGEGERD